MKKYIVDTNVMLRFFLKDNEKHFIKAKQYLSQAREGKISLILIPQVVFEINYVLKTVYSLSKRERIKILSSVVKFPHIVVKERKILMETIEKYKKISVDLVDIYLAQTAKGEGAKIFSFDKDFKKLF